jgi:hypothetical protein
MDELTLNVRISQRNPAIEGLRIVSAFAIVWFHAQIKGYEVAYAGLVTFILFTFFFACGQNLHRPLVIVDLACRLLVPWAIWWLVFAVVNLALERPVLDLQGGLIAGILTGPSVHLWYLPFIFMAIIVIDILKLFLSTKELALIAGGIAISLLLTVSVWRPPSCDLKTPWAQYAHALAPLALGMLLGLARYGRIERFCLALALLVLVTGPALAYEGVGLPYLIGTLAVITAFIFGHWRSLKCFDLTPWSGAMLGVYLVHPLALGLVHHVTEHRGVLGVIFAFVLSLAFVRLFRHAAPRASVFVFG